MKRLTQNLSATAERTLRLTCEDNVAGFAEARIKHAEKLAEWTPFNDEMFVELLDRSKLQPMPPDESSSYGASLMNTLRQQSAYDELVAMSNRSPIVAAQSAVELGDAVGKAINIDNLKEDRDAQRDPRDYESMLRRLSDMAGADDMREFRDDVRAQRMRSMRRRQMLQQRLENAADTGDVATAVAAVAKRAGDLSRALAVMQSAGLGGGEESPGNEDLPGDIIEMLINNERFREIILAIGRMQESVDARLRQSTGRGKLDLVGVVPGDDLARFTTMERAYMQHPVLRWDVLTRYAERAVNCWEYDGEDQANRGTMDIHIDGSGSMIGERIVYARAAAVAAALQALRDGRVAVFTMFRGADVPKRSVVVRNKADLPKLLRMLERRADGGTDIIGSLEHSQQVMAREGLPKKETDTLVITDGHWPVSSVEHVPGLKDEGSRVHALIIGESDTDTLGGVDEVHCIGDVLDDNAGDTFAGAVVKML